MPKRNSKKKILLVDDHPLVREGLKALLRLEDDMVVTDEASTGQEAIDLIKRKRFDVAVLDVSLPGKSGFEVVAELRKFRRRPQFLFLSMHPEDRLATRALKIGGSGYVTKERAPKEIVQAIRKVADGGVYVSRKFAEMVAMNLRDHLPAALHERLSDREFQIFLMIASGKKSGQIAKELPLSVGTVYSYRDRILKKMRMRSNTEIARYAVENRLID